MKLSNSKRMKPSISMKLESNNLKKMAMISTRLMTKQTALPLANNRTATTKTREPRTLVLLSLSGLSNSQFLVC